MVSENLQRKIDDAKVEGWEVDEEQGDHRAIMVKRKKGSLTAHVIIFLLTAWWTLGFGNLLYLAYKYFADADKKVLRDEEAEAA